VIDELYAPFSQPANRAGFLSLWRNLDYRLTDAGLARVTAPTLVLLSDPGKVRAVRENMRAVRFRLESGKT
jgi:hypothetical protein